MMKIINPKQVLMAMLIGSTVFGLSACGFALRGSSQALQMSPSTLDVQIIVGDDTDSVALKQPLKKHLGFLGVQSEEKSKNHIQVKNLNFRRYELVGTLTEVRLVLMADVDYHLVKNGKTIHQTNSIQVERSYQYNEASVVSLDQQGEKAKIWLYDNLAQRIAEQYRTHAILEP